MKYYFTNCELKFKDSFGKESIIDYPIPFFIDSNCTLIDDVNQYFFKKSTTIWNHKGNTSKTHTENIFQFLLFCEELNKNWKYISSFEIKKWIDYQVAKGNQEKTIKDRISNIRQLFNYALMKNWIKEDPFSDFNIRTINRRVNVFSNKMKEIKLNDLSLKRYIIKDVKEEDLPTTEELKDFLKNLNYMGNLMAVIILQTGVRKEELLQLKIKDIEELKESKSNNFYSLTLDARKINIKNNKSRVVVISNTLNEKIKEYINSDFYQRRKSKALDLNNDYLFLNEKGERLSNKGINYIFKVASNKINYRENKEIIRPHQLRHCFASYFIKNKSEKNEDMETSYLYLAERLGHSNPEITKKFYVKMINKQNIIEKMFQYTSDFMKEIMED